MTNATVFMWKDKCYAIFGKRKNPIVLPNFEVLTGDGWHNQLIVPPNPGNLTFVTHLSPTSTDLQMVAQGIEGVLAVEVKVACPTPGCPYELHPTAPYCDECGCLVEILEVVVPVAPTLPKHVMDGVVQVTGAGRCPNCQHLLDHDEHAAHCPNCGQAVNWTCR